MEVDITLIIGGILLALFGIILFVRERRNKKNMGRSVLYLIMAILGILTAVVPQLLL